MGPGLANGFRCLSDWLRQTQSFSLLICVDDKKKPRFVCVKQVAEKLYFILYVFFFVFCLLFRVTSCNLGQLFRAFGSQKRRKHINTECVFGVADGFIDGVSREWMGGPEVMFAGFFFLFNEIVKILSMTQVFMKKKKELGIVFSFC